MVAASRFAPNPANRWMYDPATWARECVMWPPGQAPTPYQDRIMTALADHHRVAVRGPHGMGKTTTAALTILWFATTRDALAVDWKIVATASAWRHLKLFLWPEIKKWVRHLDWDRLGRAPFNERTELLGLHLKLPTGMASAAAASDPAKLEGAHADSLLYLIDEAKMVPPPTWDAIEGAFSGGRPERGRYPEAFALALSTPGPTAGRFYDIHRRAVGLEDWTAIHVTLDDAIAAGRISRDWADQRRRQWGADSAMYHIRVLGEFHPDDDDALIPLSWVEAAVERWHAWDQDGRPELEGRRIVGVDIARTGSDETVLAHRAGAAVTRLQLADTMDTMAATGMVQAAAAATGSVAIVDSAGVGGGVVDRLRELGVHPIAYTGAAKTSWRDRTREFGFANTRSAAYWNLRQILDPAYDSTVMLPPSDELVADLTTPRWSITSGIPPRIRVEPKDDVVKRLGRSPDRGDAVAMAYWADIARSPVDYSTMRRPSDYMRARRIRR